jgi:molybdopterin converting factor small subunit
MSKDNPRPVDQTRRDTIIKILSGAAGLLAFAVGAYAFSKSTPVEGASESTLTTQLSTASGASEALVQPGSSTEVSVRVVYFGMPPTVTGTRKETVIMSNPAYLSDLKAALVSLHPGLRGMLPTMLFLVDGVSASGNPRLQDDVEVDILAQIAGG